MTTSRHAALWRDGLYPLATPPHPVTLQLCHHTAVERHVTDVSHAPHIGQTLAKLSDY